jgi:hypothetical protein
MITIFRQLLLFIEATRKQYRFRHSREGGNPAENTSREADKRFVFLPALRGGIQSTGFPPSRE